MKHLAPPLAKEYQRWREQLGEDDPYVGDVSVGIHAVLRAHFLVADYFYKQGEGIGGIGPKDINLLHSALARQFTSYGGKSKWNGGYEICATLFYGLIKNHAFHDSNKRTAFLTALHHLQQLGRTPTLKQKEFEDLTVRVAAGKLRDYTRYGKFVKDAAEDAPVFFLAEFFKRNTRDIDKRHYVVTYRELNTLLHKYECCLDNPKGNFIDVIVIKKRRRYLGVVGPKEEVRTKVAQIGFPGWTTQVGRGAIKTVREATGLTAKNGIDSEVFFHGADPMQVLIQTYHEPLRRLADR